jgi:2'-5' RNA ligase
MAYKAVDIVLLPSLSQMKLLISMINYKSSTPFKLDTRSCLPHITLAMAYVDEDNLFEAKKAVQSFAKTSKPVNCQINSAHSYDSPSGDQLLHLKAELTEELLLLHVKAKELLAKYKAEVIGVKAAFFSPPSMENISTHWVDEFYNKPDFNPHFTMGSGELIEGNLPISFEISRISLAHLGPYCTVWEVLV